MLGGREVIRFRIDSEGHVPDAVQALVETAAQYPANYEVGPFDDRELLADSTVFVSGADEVEAAEVLVSRLLALAVPFTAL